jgi:hypothetical protein
MSKRVPPTPLFRFDADQGLRGTLDAEPASLLVQGSAKRVTFFDSIVLGVLEGFTEFLPISSRDI